MLRGGEGEMVQCASRGMVMERRWKSSSSREIAPSCPRCASPNTKFCYYNNYSHSQPRYFCKGCRRYWTKGGCLRNVPIGGGCHKNRRPKSVLSRTSPPADPVSLTNCRTLNSSDGGPQNLTTSSNTSTTDAPSIDIAAIFAKFFNQNENSCSDPGLPMLPPAALPSHNQAVVEVDLPFSLTSASSSSSELVPIQFPEEQVHAQQQQKQQQGMLMIECDDVVVTQDVLLIGGYEFGLENESNRIPQYIEYPDPNGYGFQPMLSDEISQVTAFWSGTSPNFSWLTSQIEVLEPGVAPAEDHNLMLNEDCGYLDLSSYGVTSSRPY